MANIISEPIMRLYRYVAGKWAKSAEVNEEMDMFVDSHNNVVTDLNALKNQQDIDRSDLQNQITTNKNDSESRDANLQSQITTNKNDSEARDTNLQNQINSLSSTKADKAEIYTKEEINSENCANNIGNKPLVLGGTNKLQPTLEWLKSQIDKTALGQIPDGSLTEIKMANEMKKDIEGGVASYDSLRNLSSQVADLEQSLIIGLDGKLDKPAVFGDGRDGDFFSTGDVVFEVEDDVDPPIIKQYRNFILNEGHTMTTNGRSKGIIILCTGDVTINGTIDMNNKAARIVRTTPPNPSDASFNENNLKSFIALPILSKGESEYPKVGNSSIQYIVLPAGGAGGRGGNGGSGGKGAGTVGMSGTTNGTGGSSGGSGGSNCAFGGSGGGGGGAGGKGGTGNYAPQDTLGGEGGNGGSGGGGAGNGGDGARGGTGLNGSIGAGTGGAGGLANGNAFAGENGGYGGGGIIVIIARGTITIGSTGKLMAASTGTGGTGGRGGSGYPGQSTYYAGGGGGGGGGGAGGGIIVAMSQSNFINNGTIDVSGSKGGPGGPGGPGGAGGVGTGGNRGDNGTSGSPGSKGEDGQIGVIIAGVIGE